MFTPKIEHFGSNLRTACHNANVGCFTLIVSPDQMEAIFVGPHCPNPSDPAIERSISELVARMRGLFSRTNGMSCEATAPAKSDSGPVDA